jgi:hypothetical protein
MTLTQQLEDKMKGYKEFNKKMTFTKPTEKRGAVALTIGGATTKSEEGNIFSNSKTFLDTNQFNPLHNNLKLIQGGKNGSN